MTAAHFPLRPNPGSVRGGRGAAFSLRPDQAYPAHTLGNARRRPGSSPRLGARGVGSRLRHNGLGTRRGSALSSPLKGILTWHDYQSCLAPSWWG